MAMDDVIQSILDIDKKASDKLAEAEKNKLDAIKKATTEKDKADRKKRSRQGRRPHQGV